MLFFQWGMKIKKLISNSVKIHIEMFIGLLKLFSKIFKGYESLILRMNLNKVIQILARVLYTIWYSAELYVNEKVIIRFFPKWEGKNF